MPSKLTITIDATAVVPADSNIEAIRNAVHKALRTECGASLAASDVTISAVFR